MRPRTTAIVAVLVVCVFLVTAVPVTAQDIGDALLAFGIGYVVSAFGGQINSFINTLLAQRGVEWEGTTKVVPIISIGSGIRVGAAQVAGPPDLVNRVRAVAQGEIRIGDVNGNALIPVGSTDVSGGLNRIEGVGLSALIDFRL